MVSISNFSSIYELMVAFAFAYGGIESFTQWVVTFKPLDKELNTIIDLVKFSISNSKLDVSDDFYKKSTIDALSKHQESLLRSSSGLGELFENLKNGKIYSPQFYIIGFYYLSILLLGGFETNQGSIVIYIMMFLLTVVSIVFICLFININMNKCKSIDGKNNGLLSFLTHEFQVLLYIPISMVLFVLTKIYSPFASTIVISIIDNHKEWFILFSLIPILIPLSNFLFFESYYQGRLERNIDEIKNSEAHKAIQAYYNHLLTEELRNFDVFFDRKDPK